jgi:hydrogenase maturation factor HypF (carbamoyltransferase family)
MPPFGECRCCGEKAMLISVVGYHRPTERVVATLLCSKCEKELKKIWREKDEQKEKAEKTGQKT